MIHIHTAVRLIRTLCLFSMVFVFTATAHAQSTISFAGEKLKPLENGRFLSARFGEVALVNANETSVVVWVPAKNGFIQHRKDGRFYSWDLGSFRVGVDPRWISTRRFGWVHLGVNPETFGGWIYSTKLGWMKVERPGEKGFIWIPNIRSWAEIDDEETLYSFEWGSLRELGSGEYFSSRFGKITIGEFDGWVDSELFGWLWAYGDGKWFWAPEREEWLGIREDGKLWSTAEQKVIPILPPLEEAIGTRGPGGGFVWKPHSEADGKLVVLLPPSLTDGFREAWIKDQNGEIVEKGRFTTASHNGGREHYRFSMHGRGYGNVFLVSYDRQGNLVHWPIPSGANRYEY